VARSPLLRKGGAHQRSTGAERQRQRLSLDDAIEEWLETRDEASSEERETGGSGSPFFLGLGGIGWNRVRPAAPNSESCVGSGLPHRAAH
jgi:hypothetical protein